MSTEYSMTSPASRLGLSRWNRGEHHEGLSFLTTEGARRQSMKSAFEKDFAAELDKMI